MYKVFVGGISPEGEHLLTTYLNVFMPDAVIEPLKAVGIKGKMKNHAKRQDVALVIIDESLYQACVGVADDVLSLPKVHKYTDDESLNQFLISKFGRLDEVDVNESAVIPPDVLMQNEDNLSEDTYVPKNNDIYSDKDSDVITSDKVIDGSDGIIHRVVEDSYDNLAVSSKDTTSNEEDSNLIAELKDKLAKSEMMVHNLTLQLEDKTANSDDDISAFVNRIRELEQKIEEKDKQIAESGEDNYVQLGKVARAEQIISEFDGLKEKLKIANEDKSQLEYDKNNLSGQVDLLHSKVEELKNQVAEIEVLKSNLSDRDNEIRSIKSELESCNKNLEDKISEISDLNSKLDELKTLDSSKSNELLEIKVKIDEKEKEIEELSSEISKLKEDLESKKSELESKELELNDSLNTISELRNELQNKVSELEEKSNELSNALQSSSDSVTTISDLNNQINTLSSRISELEDSISSKNSEINSLSSNNDELESKLNNCNYEIESLKNDKASLTDKIKDYEVKLELLSDTESKLNSSISELDSLKVELSTKNNELTNRIKEVESLNIKISELRSSINDKDSEISKLVEENSIATSNNEVTSKAVDKIISEKNELEDKLVSTETERLKLDEMVSDLRIKLDTASNDIESKNTIIVELQAKRDSLESLVQSLQNDVINAKADAESIDRLEKDLLAERKKSAKLTSEVEVLRKTDDSSKTSELRIEIARLKSELDSVKSSSANSEELEVCKNELKESRERCSNLEIDIVEKDDIIKELENGVFGRMAGVAFPKAAYDINLQSLDNVPQNFYCIASGSSESNLALYQLLKKSCVQDSGKRILILDLATDSYIDREFGIKKANSPVNWLNGSDSFRDYIAPTNFGNVRVLTTALSYLNDLALLNVDWQKRISDLSSFGADVIIINVGCLNNVVTKILFNMFSHSMQSYVVTKATPINLRSVILNMTGFRDVSHFVTISCVGFDEKASRTMYQRLVTKYKSQILSDSDVLKF